MGDMKEGFEALDDIRRLKRQELGVNCPGCKVKFPRANAKILLPGQKCFCGYRDIRDAEALDRDFYERHKEI